MRGGESRGAPRARPCARAPGRVYASGPASIEAWRSAIFNNVVSVIDFRVETAMSSISAMTRPSARPTSEASPASGGGYARKST